MRSTKVGAPVTTTDGDNAELGDDDGSADSSRDFLGGLDTKTNMALGIADDDDCLETGTLTGAGLLLDGLDLYREGISAIHLEQSLEAAGERSAHLHDLILELGEEEVDDLELLDGERVKVDLLHALDLAGLYKTTELGDGLPLLLVLVAATTTAATSTTATAAITATITTASSKAAASTGSTGSSISHICGYSVPRRVLLLSWIA